jgi:hypothetical protein
MKQRIQLLSVLFTVASAGLAFGCGCSSEVTRVQPVRELTVEQPSCIMERAFIPSDQCLVPVGERLTTCSTVTYQNTCIGSDVLLPFGERYRTWKRAHDAMFAPVGERLIVEKSYQNELQPVGERFITVKTYHKTLMQPVGERVIIEKSYHKGMIKPVGEKSTIIKGQKTMLKKPVGERNLKKTQEPSKSW